MDRLFVRRHDGADSTQIITAHLACSAATAAAAVEQELENVKCLLAGLW